MTRNEYVKICSTCLQKEFDSNKGIICSITQEIADIDETCPEYSDDGKKQQKEMGSKIFNEGEHLEKVEDIENSSNDMIYGALWCIGGISATLADFGAIFWGAIVFGGIQFLKGLLNSFKSNN